MPADPTKIDPSQTGGASPPGDYVPPLPRPGSGAIAGLIGALGLALIVIPAVSLKANPGVNVTLQIIGAIVLVAAAVVLGRELRGILTKGDHLSEKDRKLLFDRTLFDWHATGLSFFFMVIVALMGVVTILLLSNGVLAATAKDFAAQLAPPTKIENAVSLSVEDVKRLADERDALAKAAASKATAVSLVLLLSLALSWCGAGLYVVQRLEVMRDNPNVTFNFMEFFRGLWSRLGQANLYTLLFFLLIWVYADPSAPTPTGTNGSTTASLSDLVRSFAWLPILGLFAGLLVKPVETLVFGFGTRVLAGVSAFLGTSTNGSASTGSGSGGGPNGANAGGSTGPIGGGAGAPPTPATPTPAPPTGPPPPPANAGASPAPSTSNEPARATSTASKPAPNGSALPPKITILPNGGGDANGVSQHVVGVEQPAAPKLQDLVAPPTSRPQSTTATVHPSQLWPATIKVVAPSRLTPNEPKISLPELPEE